MINERYGQINRYYGKDTLRRWSYWPKWDGFKEERVFRICTNCHGATIVRTIQMNGHKYGYMRTRTLPSQYWHDDATKWSTEPLCTSCLDAAYAMFLLEKVVSQ